MTQIDEKALEAAHNQFDNIRQFGGNVVEGVIAAYLAALPPTGDLPKCCNKTVIAHCEGCPYIPAARCTCFRCLPHMKSPDAAAALTASAARIAELERELSAERAKFKPDWANFHEGVSVGEASATAHAERLEATLREAQEAWSRYEKFLDLTGTATDIERAYNDLCAALSPASSPDVQLPKGWLADEFSRVDADVAQWSSGMKDSFKEATGIAIPPAPTPSKRGDDE